MKTILSLIRKTSLYSFMLVIGFMSPALTATSAFADEGDTPVCTAPSNDDPGVHSPVGSDASTFVYQCEGTYAGKWVNTYYAYDPITAQRTALYSPDYSFDCVSGKWSMTEWYYSPGQGTFMSARVTPAIAPNLSTGCPVATATSPATTAAGGSGAASPSGSSISNTGPNSNNGTNNNVNLNGSTSNTTTLGMNNNIYSSALSGQTFVIGNTTGGSATSGDAQSIVNLANLLQSTSNVFGPDTATFIANINGDVNGDFMFDPSALIANTGPNSSNTANNNLQINTNNANTTNAQINNTLDVGAASGDATVANNTTGGDATSGDAHAVANLMNIINSVVSSGKSFVGVVNINGNLNGDILLPQGLIDQLISSSGPTSTNNVNTNVTDNSKTTNTTNAGIANNINSTAETGDASVSGNTTGGSATSGQAGTNVTLLNLTGSNVVGKNNLLVFVNVLGHWVGLIVNAPTGSTAASLGGGITSSGPNSQNGVNTNITDNSNTTNTANLGITNNLNIHAQSGDASVTGNTTGGNATSGDANTAVNILNIAGSNLNLSDWFGVLFINVFGNWTGSFGVNTSAGDTVTAPAAASNAGSGGNSGGDQTNSTNVVRKFVSFAGNVSGSSSDTTTEEAAPTTTSASVLGSETTKKAATTINSPIAPDNAHANYLIPAIGITLAGLLLAAERFSTLRSRKA